MKRNDKEIKKQIALRFLSVLILLFSFSLLAVGQTEESDESVPVIVPDQAMEQVVRRILVWNFKLRRNKSASKPGLLLWINAHPTSLELSKTHNFAL